MDLVKKRRGMSYYENLFLLSIPILMLAALLFGSVCRPSRVPAEVTPSPRPSPSPAPRPAPSPSPSPAPSPSPPPYTTVVIPS